jgi:hypothetical protein
MVDGAGRLKTAHSMVGSWNKLVQIISFTETQFFEL